MTRHDIIELADQCGATLLDGWDVDMLTKFAKRVAEREREAAKRVNYFEVQRIANERGLDYNKFAAGLREYVALTEKNT